MLNNKGGNKITRMNLGTAPTKERRRQNGGVICEPIYKDFRGNVLVSRYRAVWESPLDAYRDHRVISKAEYVAGLRFHRAYYGAVLARRIDMRPTSEEQADMKLTECDKLLQQAYAAFPHETLRAVVDICGYNEPARNPAMLDKLKQGLGHLAVRWNTAAIEVCEHKRG